MQNGICAGFPVAALVVIWGAVSFAAERSLTGPEIIATLSDQTVVGNTSGKSWRQTFQKTGQTIYSQEGNASYGSWEVRGDQYCSQWPPHEGWSCYGVTADKGNITFVSPSGTRYRGAIK